MKHLIKKTCLLMIVAFLCVGTVSGTVNMPRVSAATAKKNGWETKKGKKYYNINGKHVTGWYTVKNKSYYFNNKGVLQPDKTKSIDKKLVKKMDKAIKTACGRAVTGPEVTGNTAKKEILEELYAYVSGFGYGRSGVFTAAKGWEYTYAKKMLSSKKGTCYHYAAAFAFLAKRATGLPVRIATGQARLFKDWQSHAWVEVKIGKTWYTFDTNMGNNVKRYQAGEPLSEPTRTDWCMLKRGKMVGNGKYYKSPAYTDVEL